MSELDTINTEILVSQMYANAMAQLMAQSMHITSITVDNRIQQMSAKIDARVPGIMRQVANEAAEMARSLAPKKSGALAESIEVSQVTTSPATDVHGTAIDWHPMHILSMDSMSQVEQKPVAGDTQYVTIRVNKPYAGLVEFGSHHGPAQPFFTPAIEWMQAEMARQIKELFIGT